MTVYKALKWLGTAYIQAFAFCVVVALIIAALMTFIAYPVQVLTTIVVGLALWGAFALVFG